MKNRKNQSLLQNKLKTNKMKIRKKEREIRRIKSEMIV